MDSALAAIASIVIRLFKEKYDIDIEANRAAIIYSDGVKAVNLYQNEADKLRNKEGKILKEYPRKNGMAFDSIKTNYDLERDKYLSSNVGVQVFEKSIESTAKNNWIYHYLLERK